MTNLQSSEQQQHCFARLKARALTEDETRDVSGGTLTDTITGPFRIDDGRIFGEDSGGDNAPFY